MFQDEYFFIFCVILECNNYRNLSNPDRAQRAVNNKQRFCDHSVYDSNFTSGWYRFTGDAGDQMASSCVPIFRCSTVFQGWLNGSHPTGNFSLARRRVCFHWNADCCHDHVDIWIRNCGGFFVYDLPMAPQCPGRYCGNGEGWYLFTTYRKEIIHRSFPLFSGLWLGNSQKQFSITTARSASTIRL